MGALACSAAAGVHHVWSPCPAPRARRLASATPCAVAARDGDRPADRRAVATASGSSPEPASSSPSTARPGSDIAQAASSGSMSSVRQTVSVTVASEGLDEAAGRGGTVATARDRRPAVAPTIPDMDLLQLADDFDPRTATTLVAALDGWTDAGSGGAGAAAPGVGPALSLIHI